MPGNVQRALQNIVHPLSLRCDIIITVCVAESVDEQVNANGSVSLKSSASFLSFFFFFLSASSSSSSSSLW